MRVEKNKYNQHKKSSRNGIHYGGELVINNGEAYNGDAEDIINLNRIV